MMSFVTDHLIMARGFMEDTVATIDKPNYPYTALQQFAIAIVCAFPALATLVVSLRIYVRVTSKSFGWGTSSPTPGRSPILTSRR